MPSIFSSLSDTSVKQNISLFTAESVKKILRAHDKKEVRSSMNFLAFDLGGSSGKLFLITVNQHKLKISCIHQFKNAPVSINGGLYWDFIHIYDELCTGLRKAVLQTRAVSYTHLDVYKRQAPGSQAHAIRK